MWWAAALCKKTAGHPRPLVCRKTLNEWVEKLRPTQMAIPLQMDEGPEQLVAANRRAEGVARKHI
jgi:hypothetical protein